MKKRNRAIILVVLLGTLTFWLLLNNKKGTIKESLKDFAVEDTASINKIFLADKANHSITLQRMSNGEWKVNDKYIARKGAITTLLRTIKKLQVKQPVPKKGRDNVIKDLASKSTKIEIYQNNELVKVYYVGGETQDGLGTYMLMHDHETGVNSSMPFIMYIPGFDGFLTTRYFTSVSEWRESTVFRYLPSDIKSIKVNAIENPQSSYEIFVLGTHQFEVKRTATNTVIAGFDTAAVKQYLSYFQNLNFEELIVKMNKSQKDSILANELFFSVEVTDKNNNKNMVKMYHREAPQDQLDIDGQPLKYDLDRMYGLINNGEDFATLQYQSFGKIMQPLDYFFKTPANAASSSVRK